MALRHLLTMAVFTGVGLLSAGAESAPSGAAPLFLARPDDAQFKPVPGAPGCLVLASLRGDASKGPATFMTRLEPGCVAPWHWHTPTEETVMLKGTAVAQMRGEKPTRLAAGAYTQFPSHHVHRFRCEKKSPCIILTIADEAFDIHWVDQADREISLDEASRLATQEGTAGW